MGFAFGHGSARAGMRISPSIQRTMLGNGSSGISDSRRYSIDRFRIGDAPLSGLLAGKDTDPVDDLLPAFAHILECGIVLQQDEAGMHKSQPCAAVDPRERPG